MLWVLEGYAGSNRGDLWHAASAFVHDGALGVVAGSNREGDVGKLTPPIHGKSATWHVPSRRIAQPGVVRWRKQIGVVQGSRRDVDLRGPFGVFVRQRSTA